MSKYDPNQDIDFLREKFSKLNKDILPSQRIAPEVLVSKLEDAAPKEKKAGWIFSQKRLAYALCAAFVCCIALVYGGLNKVGVQKNAELARSSTGAIMFGLTSDENSAAQPASPELAYDSTEDYSLVRGAMAEAAKRQATSEAQKIDGIGSNPLDDGSDPEAGGMGGGGGEDRYTGYSETNSQTESMDEADIVKTDGDYIYYTTGTEVKIAKASKDGSLELSAEIDVSKENRYVLEIFQQGNSLTLLCNNYDFVVPQTEENSPESGVKIQSVGTTVELYDITDRTKPVKTREVTQEGGYVTSRVSGDSIYIISSRQTFTFSEDQPVNEIVPHVYDSAQGDKGVVSLLASDIILPDEPQDNSYATVTALRLYDNSSPVSTRAVLGGAENLYCSKNNVYLLNTITHDGKVPYTSIVRLAFNGDSFTGVTQSEIEGKTLNNFSVDEYNGCLRAFTQTPDNNANLFVLDSSLSTAASLTGFANGKTIYAVRFDQENAYVATYDETDPVLVFDLSDPSAPKLSGAVKVKGFSTYLHPVGAAVVAGIGYNTAQAEGKAFKRGIMFTLFDFSNRQSPKKLQSLVLGDQGSYTEAIQSYKAFLYSGENELIGIPITLTKQQGDGSFNPNAAVSKTFSGYYLFELKESKLKLLGKIANDSYRVEDEIRRGLCIGNILYTASENTLKSIDMSNFNTIDSLQWNK